MESNGDTPEAHAAITPLPASVSARGWLVPIGGRMQSPDILTRFIDLCGGCDARIVIIPTASNEADCAVYYAGVFEPFHQQSAQVIPLLTRQDAAKPELLQAVADATGVFFTGGNQLKLATMLGGTPMATLLRARYAAGMPVAGTSAGAAFLSDHMIAFGEEGSAPRAAMVTTVVGLGLTERYIIDQHFRERDRLGRLVTAIAYNPVMLGLGVDEDTAAFISPDDVMHVVGTGAVTVVDPVNLDGSAILEAVPGTPLELPGMTVHVLEPGSEYDLTQRPATA
ncbi:MAG TPA: cyanophycinase [Gemmatimonas sp.]|nr:cyanophycinase [Gemmatimonas sp.]